MLSKLFKVDSKGKMRYWAAWAENGFVTTISGIVGAESTSQIQEQYESKPTNVGKKNGRSRIEQAIFEVEGLYRDKIEKKRYHADLASAHGYISSDVQLAHDYTKKKNSAKIQWGKVDGQVKLDGVRCRITLDRKAGVFRAWSRQNKDYLLPETIYRELLEVFNTHPNLNSLDGEIYVEHMDFEDIVSRVKNVKHPERDQLQFWIYDTIEPTLTWEQRRELINAIDQTKYTRIHRVQSVKLDSYEKALTMLELAMSMGFEGLILRNWKGLYLCGRRSYDLQKWKLFEDAEFQMVGVELDKRGHGVGVFETAEGKRFNARWKASDAKRQLLAECQSDYVHKKWTIRFQKWSQEGVPIFPVAIAVRDYE